MLIAQAETPTEEVVEHVAIVALVVVATVIAEVAKREHDLHSQGNLADKQQRAHQANRPGLGRSNW
jgi:hypothetical protein